MLMREDVTVSGAIGMHVFMMGLRALRQSA